MRTKVTLVLIFLNVALFFFIFKFERNWRTERASHEARRRVLGPEIANVLSLEINGPNSPQAVKLARRGDGWHLTQPFEWAANPPAVSRILTDLELLEHISSFSVRDLAGNNQTLADYGLEQPKLTVTFTSADPSYPKNDPHPLGPFVLRIGDKTPDGNQLYVLSPDGERVHVVGRSLADSLLQPVDELRLAQIFSIPVFEVRSFNLQPSAPANLRIRLRTDGNRWSFEAPIIARASKTAVVRAINDLNGLQVKSFVPSPPPNVAPATNPTLRISLEGNNRTETLYIGTPVNPAANAATPLPDTEYYAKMENTETLFTVVIPGELRRKLDHAQRELREQRLLDFDLRAVTAISLSTPNQPELTLQRLESAAAGDSAPWQIARRDPAQGAGIQPADGAVIQRLLEQLAMLSAREFLSDAPTRADLENWGLTAPERKITLTLANEPKAGATTISLEIGVGPDRGSKAYARVGGAEFVYEVDAEILRETPVQALDYRDRQLRELPAGAQIAALKLTDLSLQKVIFERTLTPSAADSPVVPAPDEKTAAVERVLPILLAQVRTLRAKAFVEDQFVPTENVAGETRPWKYQLEATIALVGGAAGAQTSVITLLIGERRGGITQQATSREFGAVWELEQPLIDALWTLTYGPRDPGPPPALVKPEPAQSPVQP